MPDVKLTITSLLELLENETDEARVLSVGTSFRDSLREMWRAQKTEFSQECITQLQEASHQLEAVQLFLEEEEEFQYISDSDDANDVIARLYPLVEALDGLAVAGRVEKEIRELLNRKRTMPTSAARTKSASLSKGIQSLSANAPNCRKCESKMTLRESNGSFFWGCSTFPKCWSTRRLSKSELGILNA